MTASEFVYALTGDLHSKLSFQVFDDTDEKDDKKARKLDGDLADLEPKLREINDKRCGVFVYVNALDGKGHTKANVCGLRALFVDSDKGPLPELPLRPSFVTVSAHGEHGYWLLKPGERVEDFSAAQKALAEKLDTDRRVCNVNRVMRLPGFHNHKSDLDAPFLVGLRVNDTSTRYTIREVLSGLGCNGSASAARTAGRVAAPPRSACGSGYGSVAMRAEVARVLSSAQGERNDALNRAAYSLGQLVAGGALSHDEVVRRLTDAGVEVGLSPNEAARTIESGMTAGALSPRGVPERDPVAGGGGGGAQVPRRDAPLDDAVAVPAASNYALTDLGNCERLVARHGKDLRYVPGWGWLVWDGGRWQKDALGAAMVLAKRTARGILAEALEEDDKDRRKKITSWSLSSESKGRLEAMLALAQSDPKIAAPANAFDSDPWLLNVSSGTVDLRTGKHRPAAREDLITKMAHVAYNKDTDAPKWRAHLGLVFGGDLELQVFFQRVVGYCLTGVIRDRKCLFFLHGAGRNGKGVTVRALREILGDYAMQVAPTTYLVREKGSATCDIARLAGVRVAVCSEAPEGGRGAGEAIKAFGGGDPITARFLFKGEFEFRPVAKHMWNLNDLPKLRDDDGALWDRILKIPFLVRIPDEKCRTEDVVDAELRSESSGVLNWAIAGCLAWQAEGLRPPAVVLSATSGYRAGQNPLADFLADRTRITVGATVLGEDLRSAYLKWCEGNKWKPVGPKKFTNSLTAAGFISCRVGHKNQRQWDGIELLRPGEEATDAPDQGLNPDPSIVYTSCIERSGNMGVKCSNGSSDDDPDDELF